MSEYQYVAFRAVDGPVSDDNLDYMHQQSTRAEITSWAFDNEYHYGDFRGNAIEMLRRGYDIHLHYANFGRRKLLIRLPLGLPDPKSFNRYFVEDSLSFVKDKQGPGGCLLIEPFIETGELDDLWNLGEILDRLVPLRAEILDGDLRPLYLAHLAVNSDGNHDPDEEMEGPVPAGLEELTDAQCALAELYGLSDYLIAAAATESPPLPTRDDSRTTYALWLGEQPGKTKDAWLTALMELPNSLVRSEMLAKYRADRGTSAWPTVSLGRTIAQLQTAANEVADMEVKKEKENAALARKKRLTKMAANPIAILQETEELITQRSRDACARVSELLSELREALLGGDRSDLAERQALKLKTANPKLRFLTAELRRNGFVLK